MRDGRRLTRRRRLLLLGTVLVVLGAALLINAPGFTALYYRWRFGPVVAALPPAAGFVAGDRVLVTSPHPDDESLCCAGMIQQALAAGAEVFIVWFTSGDGFELDAVLTQKELRPGQGGLQELALRRVGEARAAAQALGVPDGNLFFLGYPDGGLQTMLLEHYLTPYTSRYTGLQAVAIPQALSPGAAYTGENLIADLQKVVEQVAPTVVLAPSPRDRHPDHRSTGDVVLRVLEQQGRREIARWWIVHGALEWPLPKGLHRNLPLYPPPRGSDLPWQRVDLSAEQETVKLRALRAHRSQMEVLGRFMEAFVKRNELVSPEPEPREGVE